MKKIIFFMFILAFSLISVFHASGICVNNADNYASEVLLNSPEVSYNLKIFNSARNILIQGNQYILASQYSPNLALILEEQSSPLSGLSVRLQIPVKSEEPTLPFVKFVATSSRTLNFSEGNYNNWRISCTQDNPVSQCEFIKDGNTILASLVSGRYDLTFELRGNFTDCGSCDGRCIVSGKTCISKSLKNDLEGLLKHFNLISYSIEEVLSSYRVISSGKSQITDLIPESSQDIDWQEAMKQELKRLKTNGIVLITDSDIEKISELSIEGKAGQNSRIVYGENIYSEKKWLYYYETKFPTLTNLNNCAELPKSLVPTGMVVFTSQQISTYYLIPLVTTIFLIVLVIVLILTARLIDINKRKKKLKPITSLQAT